MSSNNRRGALKKPMSRRKKNFYVDYAKKLPDFSHYLLMDFSSSELPPRDAEGQAIGRFRHPERQYHTHKGKYSL